MTNNPKIAKALGPYTQGVLKNNIFYSSGQIAIEPTSGKLIKGDIEAETKQVLENIKHLLDAFGLVFSDIVKSSIFLTDLNNFEKVNTIYASYFKGNYPARETVQISKLPKNANIEISVIAIKNS